MTIQSGRSSARGHTVNKEQEKKKRSSSEAQREVLWPCYGMGTLVALAFEKLQSLGKMAASFSTLSVQCLSNE